jgi:hypothetical protein
MYVCMYVCGWLMYVCMYVVDTSPTLIYIYLCCYSFFKEDHFLKVIFRFTCSDGKELLVLVSPGSKNWM